MLGLKFQRDVRASILVQEAGIPSCGEAVRWKFEDLIWGNGWKRLTPGRRNTCVRRA